MNYLRTSIQEIESAEELQKVISENENVMVCCGRMGPMCIPVYEIMEELDTKVMVGELFDTVEYDYPKFHLSMQCYLCQVKEGDLRLKEHENAKWLDREHLFDVDWLPADIGIISHLEKKLS